MYRWVAYEMKKLLICIAMIFASQSYAEKLTEEYVEERRNVRADLYKAYDSCQDQVGEKAYELALQICESEAKGQEIVGGCEHIAGYESQKYRDQFKVDCSHLKPTVNDMLNELEIRVISKGIKKYQ